MPIKRKLLIAMIINVSLNKQGKKNKKRDRSLVPCKTVWKICLKKNDDAVKSKIKKQENEIENK